MKEIFMALINGLTACGNIKEANLYSSGNFATITVEIFGNTYKFAITKEYDNGNN